MEMWQAHAPPLSTRARDTIVPVRQLSVLDALFVAVDDDDLRTRFEVSTMASDVALGCSAYWLVSWFFLSTMSLLWPDVRRG